MVNIKEKFQVFYNYRFLLGELVSREIKLKYKRSVLGILWSVLNPLLMMTVLSIVFSKLFRFQIPNYLVYYLSGSLLFGFMQEATSGALYSIIGNAGLIKKVYIPKYIFPIAKTVSALVNFTFSLIALALVALFTGIKPSFAILVAPILFLSVFLFVLGLTLFFSTYTVFFRDLIHFHAIFMMIWMYLTPIFYPENILPEAFAKVMYLNPLYDYIKCFRMIVLEGRIPSLGLFCICFAFGIAFLLFGAFVFRRNQKKFLLYF